MVVKLLTELTFAVLSVPDTTKLRVSVPPLPFRLSPGLSVLTDTTPVSFLRVALKVSAPEPPTNKVPVSTPVVSDLTRQHCKCLIHRYISAFFFARFFFAYTPPTAFRELKGLMRPAYVEISRMVLHP